MRRCAEPAGAEARLPGAGHGSAVLVPARPGRRRWRAIDPVPMDASRPLPERCPNRTATARKDSLLVVGILFPLCRARSPPPADRRRRSFFVRQRIPHRSCPVPIQSRPIFHPLPVRRERVGVRGRFLRAFLGETTCPVPTSESRPTGGPLFPRKCPDRTLVCRKSMPDMDYGRTHSIGPAETGAGTERESRHPGARYSIPSRLISVSRPQSPSRFAAGLACGPFSTKVSGPDVVRRKSLPSKDYGRTHSFVRAETGVPTRPFPFVSRPVRFRPIQFNPVPTCPDPGAGW